jgi:hypothetical protein
MFIYVNNHHITDNVTQYKNAIVIDKNDVYFLGSIMTVKLNNDSIVEFRCYDIIFNKYNVGDTIK